MVYLTGILPALFGVMAIRTNDFRYKAGVTLTCMLILLLAQWTMGLPAAVWVILAAFACSIVGDFFLSHKKRNPQYYLWGVSSFWLAHLGYLVFTWSQGTLQASVFWLLLLGYGAYFALRVGPAIGQKTLAVAVFLYVVISCLSLAAAVGMDASAAVKSWMIVGIGLILISDTIIGEVDFVGTKGLGFLILPTYYAAHISILYALLHMR